jgi:enoyl-CoA hydratase/carnithine racemase
MKLDTDKMIAAKDSGIGWITFNNPDRRNAMSLEMWQAAAVIFDDYARDPDVRVVVMKGAGDKAFVSGADISQFAERRNNAEAAAEYNRISSAGAQAMIKLEKPLIAMIRGFCMGGGLAIAMRADLRIATVDSKFGIPAAKLGIAYAHESVRSLVSLVGPAYAKQILFTGRQIDAAEALRIGLVNEVVPIEALEQTVRDYAATMSVNALLSMKASKLTVNMVVAGERDQAMLDRLAKECFDSADYKEGRTAFMEKRKPAFTGR